MQTKACFKKEFLAFRRSGRVFVITAVIIGIALIYTLFSKGVGLFFDAMTPVYDDIGLDVSGVSDILGNSVSSGITQAIAQISVSGLIVFLLMINSYAGGEQKKRSVIIPKTAGLRSFSYIFPKFIIYPLSILAIAIIAVFASWGISSLIYDVNDVSFAGVLSAGALLGLHMMFYACIHLTIGTATGRAARSAIICIASSLLVPIIFGAFGSGNVYNPFTMSSFSATVVRGSIDLAEIGEIAATVLIALAIMAILYFLALFVQNAKKIDNSGNEARL